MKEGKREWWKESVERVFSEVRSSERGLTEIEARRRLQRGGRNEIQESARRYGFDIFVAQFKSPLILVLIGAAIIAYFLGEHIDTIVILLIVLLSSLLGFFQEYKAERAVRELKKYLTFRSRVSRNEEIVEVDTRELVPGDVIMLGRGDIIPADVRLFKVEGLTVDEATLSGESVPVQKKIELIRKEGAVIQDMRNMAFMGTAVASGRGLGVVVATGEGTVFGKTARFLDQDVKKSEFQKSMKKFGDFLVKVILGVTLFIFLANAFLHKAILDSFLFAVAVAVGITPEVLPIIITITLARGAVQMAREKVITKRLDAVEDLGNIDILCCDKTGTLTEGMLSLHEYVDSKGKKDEQLVLYGLLCNAVRHRKAGRLVENLLDRAIWDSSSARRLEAELQHYKVLDEEDFDFRQRRMRVLVEWRRKRILIVKGAPESIIAKSAYVLEEKKRRKMTVEDRKHLEARVVAYEKQGYEVLAVAEKETTKKKLQGDHDDRLVMVGFLIFFDPPKSSVKDALKVLDKLGIAIKIISGDSLTICQKICADVELKIIDEKIVTGEELDHLTLVQFEEVCAKYNIFARVTPEQKYRIVQSLNKDGHIVGFLGDGVNDTPALHAAGVGISVDSATSVAKEAADIILLKKSLHVLSDGILQGRRTFGNIMKYVLNTISSDYGNMMTVAISSLFLPFIPLLPSQILLNNLIADVPSLTIASDNVDVEYMKKPKRWNIQLIGRFMVYFGVISSFFDLVLIIPLILFFKTVPELFRTAWFLESVLTQIIVIFVLRTHLVAYRSRPSKWLIVTGVATIFFSVLITYSALGKVLFQFVRMPWQIGLLVGIIVPLYALTVELVKRQFFKRFEI